MPRKTAGNTTGAGIKLVKIPRDGNLIVENPEVAVGRITSRPAGDILYIYRYITLQAQQPAHLQGVILACREREREFTSTKTNAGIQKGLINAGVPF